ncbi:MAG: YdcH family protein [bacterium]
MNSNSDDTPPFTIIESDTPFVSNKEQLTPCDNDEGVEMQIRLLKQEHRDLDVAIQSLEEKMPYDRLTLQRMKKRKLLLKDKITKLSDGLHPDIIA